MKIREKVLAGVLTSAITATALVTALWPASPAYAEYTVDFSQGDYSTWDGTSYTFDWYESPVIEDGVTTYTIASASDLAGLCVLTNNLSASEFSGITSNIAAEDAGYIASVDTFEGKTIKLDCDIDLADFDWMPIAYPWFTANLTSRYSFTNTSGNMVTYNGVDHIPDDVVDAWVGDENGNPISTRYLEYPESDLRFRDYINVLTSDKGMHPLLQDTNTEERSLFNVWTITSQAWDSYKDTVSLPVTYVGDLDWELHDIAIPYTLKNIKDYRENKGFAGVFDGGDHKVRGLHPSTPWTDDTAARLSTYDPIAKGLFGAIAEEGIVKNLNVKGKYTEDDVVSYSAFICGYNYGNIDKCYVEGDMKQGLVEMRYPTARKYAPNGQSEYRLSTQAGTVMPLGNSGFVTAQNYGTISNTYTVGAVTQAYRQFGFFAATNYGTIAGCTNRASFTTERIETDFHTDEWTFVFDSEEYNPHANVSSYVFYPFASSDYFEDAGVRWTSSYGVHMGAEGSCSGHIDVKGFGYIYADEPAERNPAFSKIYDPAQFTGCMTDLLIPTELHSYNSNFYTCAPFYPIIPYNGHTVDEFLNRTAARVQYEDTLAWHSDIMHGSLASAEQESVIINQVDKAAWLPALYETQNNASIAANHLYGVYSEALVGGIVAVNEGTIRESANKGNIVVMENTSPRNNFKTYEPLAEDEEEPTDYYSYIRPSNAYGIFATATDTVNMAGGICAINLNTVESSINSGDISKRELHDIETFEASGGKRLNMIALTANGFHQNGVVVDMDGAADFYQYQHNNYQLVNPYTVWGYDWWVTEDNKDEYVGRTYFDTYSYNDFDRNMPYPFTYSEDAEVLQYTGGICAKNIGALVTSGNEGRAKNGICETSITIDGHETAYLDGCYTNTASIEDYDYISNMVNVAYNTSIKNCTANSSINKDSEAAVGNKRLPYLPAMINSIYQDGKELEISNNTVTSGIGVFGYVYGDENIGICVENTYQYDSVLENEDYGIFVEAENVTIDTLYNLQNCYSPTGDITTPTSIRNIYNWGDSRYAFTQSLLNADADNLNFYGSTCDVLLPRHDEGIKLSNITAYAFNEDGTLGTIKTLGTLKNSSIEKMTVFANCGNTLLQADGADVSDVMIYGNTSEYDVSNTVPVYLYKFDNSHVSNFVSQVELDVDYKLYSDGYTIRHLPGVLKAVTDTNVFENCVIQSADGVLSYATTNISGAGFDNTILTDASLVYGDDPRVSGALAYYADKGNTAARTYEWTVAYADVIDTVAGLEDVFDVSKLTKPAQYTLPVYTRKIQNEGEEPFYRFNIVNNAAGLGEIKGSFERNGITWTTRVHNELFPRTALFCHAGEDIKLTTEVYEKDYSLIGMTRATANRTEEIPSSAAASKPYLHTAEVMPATDVDLIGVWSGVYTIEVDPNCAWVNVTPNTFGAPKDMEVSVNVDVVDTTKTLKRLYYCPYVLNADNLWVLDRSTEVDIPLSTATFKMPEANIMLFAEAFNNGTDITEFVLGGEHGVITGNNIVVTLTSSIDITNIAPDRIVVSDGAVLSPAADMPQDFTKSVAYTVTAPSGAIKTYSVSVIPKVDGTITSFNLLGYDAVIDADNKVIALDIPKTLDVTDCIASVVWSGASITPDVSVAQNWEEVTELQVTASSGDVNIYTLNVQKVDISADAPIITFETADTNLTVVIDEDNKEVRVTYPYGADVSDVVVTSINVNGSTNVVAGEHLNLTKSNNLVVKDAMGAAVIYKLVATEALDTRKMITQFSIYGHAGVVDEDAHTIVVTLPSKYDVTNIAPDAIGYYGASITGNGVKKDFTNAVAYTVTAKDGSTVTYTVTVVKEG